MCQDHEQLYNDACYLEGRLYRVLWWRRDCDHERVNRILGRAKARRLRRGEALTECIEAENDSRAWAEAEAIYEMERQR